MYFSITLAAVYTESKIMLFSLLMRAVYTKFVITEDTTMEVASLIP